MKSLITIIWFVILTSVLIFAQSSPKVSLHLTVKDNTGKAQGTRNLQFGLDSSATDAIDSPLGELSLPPLPPSGVMDARFVLPDNESSASDFRCGSSLFEGEKTYTIQYQTGEGGNNIKIIWDLPVLVRGRLQDMVTGSLINVKMEGRDSLVVSDPSAFPKLKMIISYHLATVKPDAPALLQPANNSLNISIKPLLSWTRTKGADSYILMVASDADFKNIVIADSAVTDSMKQIGPLGYLKSFYWKAAAKNEIFISAFSPVRYFRTVPEPVSAPTGLTATALTSGGVNLKWNDNSANENGFNILRKEGDTTSTSSYQIIGNAGANSSSYFDNKTKAGTKYSYQICAFTKDSAYSYSNQASATALTSVAADQLQPYDFSLSQNYPNPFNPSTIIKFSLKERCHVNLAIYNELGEIVAELVNGELNSGIFEISWNAENFSSGFYVYELRTNSFTARKKMLYIK